MAFGLLNMEEAYSDSDVLIISACRTPIGRFCGGLASVAAHELGANVISECIKRVSVFGFTLSFMFFNYTLNVLVNLITGTFP